MSDDKSLTWKLTVRLAKKDMAIEDCVNQGKVTSAALNTAEWATVQGAKIYSGRAYGGAPKWKDFFGKTADLGDIDNRGAVCFIVLPVNDRLLFVSFGPAQIYLKSEAFERDFGLKVTLNSVAESELVSIDAKTAEDLAVQRRIQASQKSDVSAFGINIDRDLLKGVAGKPSSKEFASLLAGSDTLTIHSQVNPSTLQKKVGEVLAAYENDSYKRKFPWVDYVRPVKDKELIIKLNDALVADLENQHTNSSQTTSAYLAIPEIIDHQRGGTYGFIGLGKAAKNDENPAPELSQYIAMLGDSPITLDSLKQHKIGQRGDGSDTFFEKWSVYKCLVYETKLEDQTYTISEGDWYQVDNEYEKEIDGFFKNLLENTDSTNLGILPNPTNAANEAEYNNGLKQSLPPQLVCMDREVIKTKDWSSGIESCDFYSSHRDFIHIKNETSSSTLSHLFMQGAVSAQVFKRSEDYRKLLKSKIKEKNESVSSTVDDEPDTSDYRVVYAILRRPYRDGKFNLPFFSKVALKSTAEQLMKDFGYNVGLYWIKKETAKNEV